MPHLSYEYSANLDPVIDHNALCVALHSAALETGLFELGGVRVRSHKCKFYAVADLLPQNGFVHLTISVGAGRPADAKKSAGDHIWAALVDFFGSQFETPHFALSMEIREIDPDFSWKQNAIHPRIHAQKT
jgi:5-carboxymethyl-2-hydroxymuconate isomerase